MECVGVLCCVGDIKMNICNLGIEVSVMYEIWRRLGVRVLCLGGGDSYWFLSLERFCG